MILVPMFLGDLIIESGKFHTAKEVELPEHCKNNFQLFFFNYFCIPEMPDIGML